jgi:hypothetical protein
LALFQRAIRRDLSVIPHLLPKLTGTHARYWWQTARYLWSAELTKALADAVARLAVLPTSGSEGSTDSDLGYSVLGEFLMERDAPTAETILMANRDKLQSRGVLVQAALYHATPALLNLAADVVRNQQNPRELFKHLTNHMGNRVQGRRGIFRIEQLNALIPYLSLLESSQILFLTELCARRGWRSFAERYLSTLQSHDMLRGRDVEALDKAYNETTRTMHQGWMYFGVERGFPLDELVEVGLDWLQRHLDLKGLTIICPSFASTARRKDVRRLIAMARHVPDSSDILSDTEFAVAVRSAE